MSWPSDRFNPGHTGILPDNVELLNPGNCFPVVTDISDIGARQTRAKVWFEALRDEICTAFEALEDEAPASLYPGAASRVGRTAHSTSGVPSSTSWARK